MSGLACTAGEGVPFGFVSAPHAEVGSLQPVPIAWDEKSCACSTGVESDPQAEVEGAFSSLETEVEGSTASVPNTVKSTDST